MRRTFSQWMVAAVAPCVLVSSCVAEQPAASPAAPTAMAAAVSDPTVPLPEAATAETVVFDTEVPDAAATSTMSPVLTSSPAAERLTTPSTTPMDAERVTLLDFRNDPERDSDRDPADSWGDEYRIGRDAPAGWWSWRDASADDCVYIAIMPTVVINANDELAPVSRDETDRLVFLDAREPAVLVDGEAIIGYAAVGDIGEIVSRSVQSQCFLELVGTYANPGGYYLCRHLVSGSVRRSDGRWTGVESSLEQSPCIYPTRGG